MPKKIKEPKVISKIVTESGWTFVQVEAPKEFVGTKNKDGSVSVTPVW